MNMIQSHIATQSPHTYVQSDMNIQSHVVAQPSHTYAQSHTFTNLQSPDQRDTIVQSHIDNRTHTTHTKSYKNLQPCSSSHNTHISQTAQPITQNYDTQHVENYADNVFFFRTSVKILKHAETYLLKTGMLILED